MSQYNAGHRRRAVTITLLAACQTLFLWMFLSTDPLEQLAEAGSLRSTGRDAAFRFAAAWRHGMNGNSWLYMPGFFALAAAVWLHARTSRPLSAAYEAVGTCGVALVAAALGSSAGARDAAAAFALAHSLPIPAALPLPSFQAVWRGVYTLMTWSVFVLASRQALTTRCLRPFALPAVMSVVLALARPWTVDDFVSLWRERAAAGDAIACASLASGAVLIGLLVSSEASLQAAVRGARFLRAGVEKTSSEPEP